LFIFMSLSGGICCKFVILHKLSAESSCEKSYGGFPGLTALSTDGVPFRTDLENSFRIIVRQARIIICKHLPPAVGQVAFAL
jgi:hypothetical protein